MHPKVNIKWLSCKYDRVFKSVMLSNNYMFLNALLTEIIGTKEEVINNLSTEQKITNKKERIKVMDCLIETTNAYVNIEVNSKVDKETKIRNFSYITTFYNHSTKRGTNYDKHKKYYQINLNYGSNGTIKKYNHFMQDDQENKYIDNLQIVEINMDYLKKLWYAKDERVNEYIHVLMLCLEKEELEILRKMRKGDEIIMAYEKEMNKINDDTFTWDYDRDNEMLINGMKARAKEEGFNQGISQGINQGKKEQQIEIAKKMLRTNIPIEQIHMITDVPLKKINQLLNKI